MNAFRTSLRVILAAVSTAGTALAAPSPQVPIAGSSIPQFVEPLPQLQLDATKFGQSGLATIVATDTSFTSPLQLSTCEFKSNVLPSTFVLPSGAAYTGTWTWGYVPGASCPTTNHDTYLGPVLVNVKNIPTTIKFTNSLPTVDQTKVLAYKYSTDQTLHWADPLGGEANACHMASGDPPQIYVGIPAYQSPCSLNFGESPAGVYNPVGIPQVPHLHGGEVPPALDGGPNTWFTSVSGNGTVMKGHDYYTNPLVPAAANEAVYSYPNSQSAAPLWFHDHTLGATRLNVYAGIAGGYYLVDPPGSKEANYLNSFNFLPVSSVIPLILQDRMFDTNGQFYFPAGFPGGINGPPPNPQHPYWNPEFLGDTIVVNGKAWPFLQVEPKRYRFLFLNGSNARTYEMFFVNPKTKVMGPVMWAIGSDGGFLEKPSIIDPNAMKPIEPHLVIMPGERYEVIIDFSTVAGQTLVLKNTAKAPYPGGTTPQGTTTGHILQVRVGTCPATGCPVDTSYDPKSGIALRPTPLTRVALNGAVAPGVTVAKTRELTLNEVALVSQTTIDPVTGVTTTYPGGPVEILVNNTKYSGESPRTYGDFQAVTVNGITELVSETPAEGTTEVWEIVNTTADAHPIHTHLATFQLINRQNYSTKMFTAAYGAVFPAVPGNPVCTGAVYCPGFGPPLSYNELSARTANKFGGNPDITPYLSNAMQLPDPDEVGWKDTVMAPPGMVTRFAVRFAPTEYAANATNIGYPFSPNDGFDPATGVPNGNVANSHGYVWHCHIIDHEDNEMMRQHVVVPNMALTRTYIKGTNY